MELFQIDHRFFGRAEIRLGDNLKEWRAGPVQVNTGTITRSGEFTMHKFASILFHMDAGDTDPLRLPTVNRNIQPAALTDRIFKLADLVTFRKIGIKIVLPGKDAARRDGAVSRKPGLDGEFYYFFIQHRQSPRQSEADRTSLSVGFRAEFCRAATEYFAVGQELNVNFKADDGLVFHEIAPDVKSLLFWYATQWPAQTRILPSEWSLRRTVCRSTASLSGDRLPKNRPVSTLRRFRQG